MVERLIEFSLKQRFLVLAVGALVCCYGVYSMLQLNLDAFPDVTNVQVQVNTEAPAMAPEEVEQLVTFPIESVMTGLPGVSEVRSISKTGLSVVTVVFHDNVDTYLARQLVLERLQTAKERLPSGLAVPQIGPISTGMGQIYKYVLKGEGWSAMDLRTLNDWTVKFQLRNVPGVTDVLSFGGQVRQYQVLADPDKLYKHGLVMEDLCAALKANNSNAGGWYLEKEQEQLVIRGRGLISPSGAVDDISNIVLKTYQGTPVFVKDVARVEIGSEIRQGAVTMDGHGETVMGVVLQLKGANTKKVIEGVREKVAHIQAGLPKGVTLEPVYDQSMLVEKAVGTVTSALLESAVLIIAVLFVFLGNMRSAAVILLSIPLSMFSAFIMMRWAGLSANLQSLGGLAIGIGMMVDGSVVMVESIMRRLASGSRCGETAPQKVFSAAREVGRPVFFAVLIIVVVFLPLFTLRGVEGKMFSPMAFTIAFAMLGSLLASLTVVPALSSFLLRECAEGGHGRLAVSLERLYAPVLDWALARRRLVLAGAGAALAASLAIVPFLGTEFVPALDEGTLLVRVTMGPSVSLEEAKRIAATLERKLLKYPEVTCAISQIGRAELGGDPESISNNEIYVGLKPHKEWKTAKTTEGLVSVLEKDLGSQPGVLLNFSQPIATRVDELLSGIKAQLAVKLFGEDLAVLKEKGEAIAAVVGRIPGATDVQLEQISGEEQLVVDLNRREAARYGLNAEDVMGVVSVAIGGERATEVFDGQKRFGVYIRLAPEFRNSVRAIESLWVASKDGARVPLTRVAEIRRISAPPMISRENAQRRAVVLCNVRGRDLGGFVGEARKAVRRQVALAPGYFVEWGGQFENQQRAQRTLLVVVPACLALIFALLYMAFGAARPAWLVMLNVPLALIGGIFGLAAAGQYLSVPSSIGFIALFGVAVLNGVVMVSCFRQLTGKGLVPEQAVRAGAVRRLVPVLMTASVAGLGLVPLLLSSGVGSEVQRPLAVVVVGGLVSSTLLTLVVLPVLYKWLGSSVKPKLQERGK